MAIKTENTSQTSKASKFSIVAILSFIVLVIAYIIKLRNDYLLEKRVDATLNSLLSLEQMVSVNSKLKIAIGYGSCLDVSIRSKDLIMKYFKPPKEPKHHYTISNKDELLEVFTYYFKEGAATENFINNDTFFNELLKIVYNERNQKIVGGNAAIMALRFSKEKAPKIILGAEMSSHLRSFFPDDIIIPGKRTESDNAHLIVEYASGDKWNGYVAPRANRFIVHSDSNNIVQSMSDFHDEVRKAKPNLFIIGGLQQMSNLDDGEQVEESLLITNKFIEELYSNSEVKVHLELASYSDEYLLNRVVDILVPKVDSLGMNEQELSCLNHVLMYGNASLVSESYPRVAKVIDEMRDVYYQVNVQKNGHINRIHVHTLAFQAILTKKGSGWKNTLVSSVKAALVAHRHTCGSHHIDKAKAKLIMDDSFTTTRNDGGNKKRIPFDVSNPVPCWEEKSNTGDIIEICVAPVLVCTKVLQTCGGGDNVSAAGLLLQI